MSDIVERLRAEAATFGIPCTDSVLHVEAADEIERLRAALEAEKDEVFRLQCSHSALYAEVDALRKDAERYRHAMAYGWPMKGPQCVAWTREGHMVLADTPEAAIDAAMKEPK